ncbi:Spy/CpxP family protein refolding chaperone [Paraburkholderia sp. J76]|uniref:Spy/CpxP family protein refolding chaperone n=1 Tax=Paraburkholderia sp. J76 TaxID=2805439 RepID=UPI002ABE519B|nr:Spy/CpxP family protein refolding chaperone [Paraburkholderia sp. J76]
MKKAFVILAASLSMSGAFAQGAAPATAASAASSADVRAAQHQQRVEERITWLHTQLKITPEQEPQWKAFADVMRDNGQTMADLYKQRVEGESTRNALDDMKQYAQISQAHAEDMQKLVAAFEPLYTSLSPEQKKLADQTFRHGSEHGQPGKPMRKHKGKAKPSAGAAASDAEAASTPAAQ